MTLSLVLKDVKANSIGVHLTRIHSGITRVISVTPKWVFSESKMIDIERIVASEEDRLIMQPGEIYAFRHKYFDRVGRRQNHDMPGIVFGTPYGPVVALLNKDHQSISHTSDFGSVDIACTTHFKKAVLRYMERNKSTLPLDPKAWGFGPPTLEKFMRLWICTPQFLDQIKDQAIVDATNGIEVTDGLPPPVQVARKEPKPQQPKKKKQKAAKEPTQKQPKEAVAAPAAGPVEEVADTGNVLPASVLNIDLDLKAETLPPEVSGDQEEAAGDTAYALPETIADPEPAVALAYTTNQSTADDNNTSVKGDAADTGSNDDLVEQLA